MRKSLLLVAAAAVLTLGAGPALAKKQLVIVVKGLDNPFFEAIHQGCEKWNKENASSEYQCFYTGPASTSDEAGEAQIVQDMLGKADTAAIAISPSNAKLIAQTLKTANPTVPVMTIDADLAKEDSALRKTYLGTDNYLMGVRIGDYIKKAKPKGGTICLIEGNPGADNILRRAQGTRDALTGQKGLAALKGEGGWTEVAGCPVFTNDDGAKGVQAMTDILAANPKLDAFAIEGGWPLFGAPHRAPLSCGCVLLLNAGRGSVLGAFVEAGEHRIIDLLVGDEVQHHRGCLIAHLERPLADERGH